MASTTPPKKRHRAGGDSLREQVLKFPFPMFVVPKSPHDQHVSAYTTYEADVRGALASEDLEFECDFKAAEKTWVENIDHELPCPVPLTVRGTQALVSFAPLAFKLFFAARQNAVLRRSPFPPP